MLCNFCEGFVSSASPEFSQDVRSPVQQSSPSLGGPRFSPPTKKDIRTDSFNTVTPPLMPVTGSVSSHHVLDKVDIPPATVTSTSNQSTITSESSLGASSVESSNVTDGKFTVVVYIQPILSQLSATFLAEDNNVSCNF